MPQKLIYISPGEPAFVRKDIQLLSKHFNVVKQTSQWGSLMQILHSLFRQTGFLLRHLFTAKAVVIMFGGYWAFLPVVMGKIFQRPVYLILGGADCVSFPEYHYGSLRKPLLRKIIGFTCSRASRLLPVDASLLSSAYTYDPAVRIKKQGLFNFFPGLKTPVTVIHNGFDPEFWHCADLKRKSLSFITIAGVDNHTRYRVKGIDMVIRIAGRLPGYTFHVAGMEPRFQATIGEVPGNVKFYSALSSEELRELLAGCRFYLQLSISEGFPNALCEAMLCGCIPMGSSVGAMPEIIGNTGTLAEQRDPELMATRIEQLLRLSEKELDEKAEMARNSIIARYHISIREKALLRVVEQAPIS